MMEEVSLTSDLPRSGTDRGRRLEELFEAEYDGMVRLAFTLIGNNAEAEELVQDSFVRVCSRLDEIRQPGAYLRTVVISRCRSALRHRQVVAAHRLEAPASLSDRADELWDVLERLSDEQRIAVVLRYYGGYRATEISEWMDVPAATVRSHLRRGLRVLRKELEA